MCLEGLLRGSQETTEGKAGMRHRRERLGSDLHCLGSNPGCAADCCVALCMLPNLSVPLFPYL